MGLLIIGSLSITTSFLLFWIGNPRYSIFPIFFFLLYCIDAISSLSLHGRKRKRDINTSMVLSWGVVMIGITILLSHYSINQRNISLILITLNTILFSVAHIIQYKEGISIFHRGCVLSYIISIVLSLYNGNSDTSSIMLILQGGSTYLLLLWYIISIITPTQKSNTQHNISGTDDSDDINKTISINYKEIYMYISLSLACYRIFTPNYLGSIVLALSILSILIALRQQFLAYSKEIKHEKNNSLTGRSLLQGQKVLNRYEDKKGLLYNTMEGLIHNGIVPSKGGLYALQIIQLIQTLLFVWISIRSLLHQIPFTLFRYRLGVLAFITTLFLLDRQDHLIHRYKRTGIVMVSSAFYITLFANYSITTSFIIRSFVRNCINMIACLFYDSFVPLTKRIFKRNDLIFWMITTNITAIITIISLTLAPLSGDIVFAVGCIIVGMMGFFSYNIWKKYNIINVV